MPEDWIMDVTYGKFVCNLRPEKDEVHRTCFVVGGNRINYPGDVGTPTADMFLAKILFNSVISTNNARFMMGDITFLPEHPIEKEGVHQVEVRRYPPGGHPRI